MLQAVLGGENTDPCHQCRTSCDHSCGALDARQRDAARSDVTELRFGSKHLFSSVGEGNIPQF